MPGANHYHPVPLPSQLLKLVHSQGTHVHTQFQTDNRIWMWRELLSEECSWVLPLFSALWMIICFPGTIGEFALTEISR